MASGKPNMKPPLQPRLEYSEKSTDSQQSIVLKRKLPTMILLQQVIQLLFIWYIFQGVDYTRNSSNSI